MSARRRWTSAAALFLAVVTVVFGRGLTDDNTSSSSRSPAGVPAQQEGTYRPGELGDLDELLDQVTVVPRRPDVPGYDRECGTDHGCSFGTAWTDDVDVALGHNGCDTRNDLLLRSLENVEVRPGTKGCVVIAGTLDDPYTGELIEFRKEAAHKVGIDHLYPLARAWDLGASTWTEQRRQNFANDPRNLAAVSGSANSSKSDQGPGEWLPVNGEHRCTYVARYLDVAIAYQLPITDQDRSAARLVARSCTANTPR